MEKVKVISVKPIPAGNEESPYSSCQSETCVTAPETKNVDQGKLLQQQKNASFAHRGSKVSNNYLGVNGGNNPSSRRNASNSSFKNITPWSSTKEQETTGERGNPYKTGFSFPAVSSTNCFGRSDFRASYNERIKSGPSSLQHLSGYKKEKKIDQEAGGDFVYLTGNAVLGSGLYRSNSSLELDHDTAEETTIGGQFLKREYGSHGSINVASSVRQESLYSVLQSYGQDSKEDSGQFTEPTSPKVRSKIHRLWEKDKASIFKKFLPSKGGGDNKSEKIDTSSESHSSLGGTVISNSNAKTSSEVMESDNKDDLPVVKPLRRAAIAHYDCHSLAAQLSSSRLKSVLADRSNTTTGASAAALADSASVQNAAIHSSAEELSLEDVDHGDGRSNHLVSSCPFFQNEIGGEGERIVSLSREIIHPARSLGNSVKHYQLYRSSSASSISLLEPLVGTSFWCQTLCPYVKKSPILEIVDQGSNFYSNYFRSQEHQNWFGVDDVLGPVAISIKKEKVEESCVDKNHSVPSYQYRFIFRTSELFNCQGTIREESLSQRGDKGKGQGIREAIEYVCPQLNLACLRLGTANSETEASLMKLDELGIHRKFKVGVLYCRAGQKTEEDMYNNENSGPAFSEFLEVLGQRVRLKNFDKYRGGLDKKADSTGHYSVYTQYQGCEIMFHVSTLLPFTPTNRKQLLRKRHIGNDIVTIIFQEPGALPFTPKNIRSHFQHIFVIVQAINPCTENTHYSIAVSRFQDVPMFGPPIPENATFPKSRKFVDFLLAKVINGEIAALRSEKFTCMAARTKHEYLKDLAVSHTTTTTLDTSTKFSLMGFSRASKKEKSRFKFVADTTVKGGLSWNMCLYDATLQQNVNCVLAVSIDSLVVLEETSSSVVFSTSCRSILGWTTKLKQGLHIFYHQGECLILNLRSGTGDQEGDDLLNDVVARLTAVTQGAESQELVLKRNPAGLLGFNVQQDGIITEVEPYGLAAQSGLQQGSRLVEICTVALATLSQEQMVDLLKTSMTVTVTVIPPHIDGTPRRGCNVPTCNFLLGCSEGDYENLTPPEQGSGPHAKNRIQKQLTRCDRSLSPPRSGSSSGYGTGSSSHSFSMEQSNKAQTAIYEGTLCTQESVPTKEKLSYHSNLGDSGTLKFSDYTGTLSSTSSGHSNDRWSETTADEPALNKPSLSQFPSTASNFPSLRQSPYSQNDRDYSPPPPLPVRLYQHKKDMGTAYHVSSHLEMGADGKRSPYNRRLHQTFGASCQTAAYEQGNYAVPKAIPRPVANDYIENQKLGKTSDGTTHDYDNTRYATRLEAASLGGSAVGKQANFRRNSSPLAVEVKDIKQEEEVKRKDGLMRARHSVPKSAEEATLQEHIPGSRSEEELSGSSGSSPHGFPRVRGGGGSSNTNSSPSLSSRNQSPHGFTTAAASATLRGDMPASAVRLKQSVQNNKNIQHRNSASIPSTNLQEELLKLINPDYLSDSESMGAEIREKKDPPTGGVTKMNAFPTYEMEETHSKGPVSQLNSQGTRQVAPYGGEPPLATNSGIYDCLPIPYQTIGAAEFTSRKNVFTRPTGEPYLPNECEAPKEPTKPAQESTSLVLSSSRKPPTSEGLLLTARPATVISNASTASSPACLESKEKPLNFDASVDARRHKDVHSAPPTANSASTQESFERMSSPQVSEKPSSSSPSSVIDEEWSTLVNTATLAIEKSSSQTVTCQPSSEQHQDLNANPTTASTAVPSETTTTAMPSLPDDLHKYMPIYFEKFLADSKASGSRPQSTTDNNMEPEDPNANSISSSSSHGSHTPSATASLPSSVDENTRQLVEQLERALASEQRISGKLKEEVAFLRNENTKLLKDSRAAAQQLHQFTEWFFKNIHKS